MKIFIVPNIEGFEGVEIEKEDAERSEMLKGAIPEEDGDDVVIPLPNITCPDVFVQIVWYLKNYVPLPEVDKPLRSANMEELDLPRPLVTLMSKWDDLPQDQQWDKITDLLMGANFMGINELLRLSQIKIATMIKGKYPDELRKMMRVECDFTPEETKALEEEYSFLPKTA
jgi:S-phase kinase-associated protein 1